MKKIISFLFLLFLYKNVVSQKTTYKTIPNISYYPGMANRVHEEINQQCVLDLYYPEQSKGFATVVWLHGGGLTSGVKEIPEALKGKNLCIAGINYRLHPEVKAFQCIEDAAAAIAWVFKHIHEYGGDTTLIFVAGHSAGGYLTSMVGLDKRWLASHNIEANQIAGLIPFSGQMVTHFTVRKERGISEMKPIIDSLAPLYHVRADAPPLLLITGDREKEILGRYEENAYLWRMMKVAGHTQTSLIELPGYDHDMAAPAFPLLLKEVQRIIEEKKKSK